MSKRKKKIVTHLSGAEVGARIKAGPSPKARPTRRQKQILAFLEELNQANLIANEINRSRSERFSDGPPARDPEVSDLKKSY